MINQNLYPNLTFDPARFEPIIVMAHVPNALMVNPKNLKASTVPELIEELVTANHILARERVLDSFGHISARNPERYWTNDMASKRAC